MAELPVSVLATNFRVNEYLTKNGRKCRWVEFSEDVLSSARTPVSPAIADLNAADQGFAVNEIRLPRWDGAQCKQTPDFRKVFCPQDILA